MQLGAKAAIPMKITGCKRERYTTLRVGEYQGSSACSHFLSSQSKWTNSLLVLRILMLDYLSNQEATYYSTLVEH